MRRRKWGTVRTFALIAMGLTLLVAGVAAGCGPAEESKKPSARESGSERGGADVKKPASGTGETATAGKDVAEQTARVAAAARIGELRKAEKPLYPQIADIFARELEETVGKRDAEFGTNMVAEIDAAITAARAGKDVKVNGQRVSKTLQRAFYLSVKHELDGAIGSFKDTAEASHKMNEAEAYYEGTGAEMKAAVRDAFADARSAIETGDMRSLKLAGQVIDKTLVGHFVAKVVVEAGEVISEPAEAAEKLAEAHLFYAIVADKFEDQDSAIRANLASTKSVDVAKLKALFRAGLIAKARSEAGEVMAEWGEEKAAVVALESRLYLGMLDGIDEKIDGADALMTDLEALQEAAESGDKERAEKLSKKVDAAMAAL